MSVNLSKKDLKTIQDIKRKLINYRNEMSVMINFIEVIQNRSISNDTHKRSVLKNNRKDHYKQTLNK
jgi:hypothetical protein